MKVLILTDLEGVSGVNGRPDAVGNQIINREVANRLLTEEVNAVAEGLTAAGATEIICHDGHGGADSINIEGLRREVMLYQAGGAMLPVTLCDASYDAFLQVGAHAMSGVADGFLNHTFNSHAVVSMRLNGEPIGEIGIAALLASSFDVPTILVASDRAGVREVREFLGKVETVETKVGVSRYAAINKHPEAVRDELREAARRALAALDSFPVVKKEPPFELRMEFMCANTADSSEMRGARRLDPVTVAIEGEDFLEVWSRRQGWSAGVYPAREQDRR